MQVKVRSGQSDGHTGSDVSGPLDSAEHGPTNVPLLSREATTTQRVHLFLALPSSSGNFFKESFIILPAYFQE